MTKAWISMSLLTLTLAAVISTSSAAEKPKTKPDDPFRNAPVCGALREAYVQDNCDLNCSPICKKRGSELKKNCKTKENVDFKCTE